MTTIAPVRAPLVGATCATHRSLAGRLCVVVELENGFRQPFYRSTGRNSGRPGQWFPFEGICEPTLWFIKCGTTYPEDHPLHRFGLEQHIAIADRLAELPIPDAIEEFTKDYQGAHAINVWLTTYAEPILSYRAADAVVLPLSPVGWERGPGGEGPSKPYPRRIIANHCPFAKAARQGFKNTITGEFTSHPRIHWIAGCRIRATAASARRIDAYFAGCFAAQQFLKAGFWLWSNDYDWCVARNADEALAAWCEQTGETPADYDADYERLTIEAMRRLRYIDGYDDGSPTIAEAHLTLRWSFLDQLAEEIAVNHREPPFWFAGTEY